jgi:DNA processing protein
VDDTALIWSWLNILTKKRLDDLLNAFGSLETALLHVSEELLHGLGCKEETVRTVLRRLDRFDPERYRKELEERKIAFISIQDESYPAPLRDLPDPPVFLHARGDVSLLHAPCVALVGTRKMSLYGRRVAAAFSEQCVHAGVVTVSGLALGIDAEVARQTLRACGRTIAVLGHGLRRIYPPSNAPLAEEIVARGGLLLSEYPLDTAPGKFTFPARNRIIAGLTLGTVVLEAPAESGSMITAELALEYGRDVFAVPGQIFDERYAGSHQLLARGCAKLVTSAREVFEELTIASRAPDGAAARAFAAEHPQEQRLYSVLTSMPQTIDTLVASSGLEAGAVSATLTLLELQGAASHLGGGLWVRAVDN